MTEMTRKSVYVVSDDWGDFYREFANFDAALAFHSQLVNEYRGKRKIFIHKMVVKPMVEYKPE